MQYFTADSIYWKIFGEGVLNSMQDKKMLGYMNKFLRIFREKGSDMWEIAELRKSNGTVMYWV